MLARVLEQGDGRAELEAAGFAPFMSARSIFLTGEASDLTRNLAIVLVSTAAILALGVRLLRRAYTQLTGGQ